MTDDRTPTKHARFEADASLLAELGQRLIGRPTIALGELIKNSYDADANECRINIENDQITITDNGNGISTSDFHNFWLRLGTTHKVDEQRSPILHRPLTGSKGIGRLSVQFLAHEMTLESNSRAAPRELLYAIIDWKTAIRGETLSSVNIDWDNWNEQAEYLGKRHGTRITLRGLKNEWNSDALKSLGKEVWRLRSPFHLFGRTGTSSDFNIEVSASGIEDARSEFDGAIRALIDSWRARITGRLDGGRLGNRAEITVEFKKDYPRGSKSVHRFKESLLLPVKAKPDASLTPLVDRAYFEIMVFKTEGRQAPGLTVGDVRKYLSEYGNVSVYDAGFRMPYYGQGADPAGQDWLSIAVDQGRRLNASELLPERLRMSTKYMQDLPAPGRIFGAVDIDTNHESRAAATDPTAEARQDWLQIQPGRDRLIANDAFIQLRDLLRFALDFYANRYRLLDVQLEKQSSDREPSSRRFERAMEVLDESKGEIQPETFRKLRREVVAAQNAAITDEAELDRRAALLAPLATAGMSALALVHELAREIRLLDDLGGQLAALSGHGKNKHLKEMATAFEDARKRLESIVELFAPLISEEDTAATDRLRIRPIVEQTVEAMRVLMPGVSFDYGEVPARASRFPVGAWAEWSALLQNVLSNAWNAMLESGNEPAIHIAAGTQAGGKEWLRISDTGKGLGVTLAESSKFFEPFERGLTVHADRESMLIGGHGLGLAIVRMIARRRDANVAFVKPRAGFSTTFEISWRVWGK